MLSVDWLTIAHSVCRRYSVAEKVAFWSCVIRRDDALSEGVRQSRFAMSRFSLNLIRMLIRSITNDDAEYKHLTKVTRLVLTSRVWYVPHDIDSALTRLKSSECNIIRMVIIIDRSMLKNRLTPLFPSPPMRDASQTPKYFQFPKALQVSNQIEPRSNSGHYRGSNASFSSK